MHVDPVSAALPTEALQTLAPPATGLPGVEAGPHVSLTDVGRFEHAIHTQMARLDVAAVDPASPVAQALTRPLDQMNEQMETLGRMAEALKSQGGAMSPGDMLRYSAQSQLFLLSATMASNVATRTSDGISQLFKQQS